MSSCFSEVPSYIDEAIAPGARLTSPDDLGAFAARAVVYGVGELKLFNMGRGGDDRKTVEKLVLQYANFAERRYGIERSFPSDALFRRYSYKTKKWPLISIFSMYFGGGRIDPDTGQRSDPMAARDDEVNCLYIYFNATTHPLEEKKATKVANHLVAGKHSQQINPFESDNGIAIDFKWVNYLHPQEAKKQMKQLFESWDELLKDFSRVVK